MMRKLNTFFRQSLTDDKKINVAVSDDKKISIAPRDDKINNDSTNETVIN